MRFKAGEPRPLIWRGTSKSDYTAFPVTVQREMGYALFLAQAGKRHATMAKTLRGFGGGLKMGRLYAGRAAKSPEFRLEDLVARSWRPRSSSMLLLSPFFVRFPSQRYTPVRCLSLIHISEPTRLG